MVNKYGVTTWDEADHGSNRRGNKQNNSKDVFLKLQEGPNVVRILTKPYQFVVHKGWKPSPNDPGFGWRVMCSKFNSESCTLCDAGLKTQTRWYVGVIDRRTQSYKVLDISYAVFKNIKTFSQDEDWGNPESYDIDIKVDKKADPNSYYSPVCKPKKALTEADLAIKAKIDSEYAAELLTRCTPPTNEGVLRRMESIREYVAKNGKKGALKTEDQSSEESDDSQEEDLKFEAPNA